MSTTTRWSLLRVHKQSTSAWPHLSSFPERRPSVCVRTPSFPLTQYKSSNEDKYAHDAREPCSLLQTSIVKISHQSHHNFEWKVFFLKKDNTHSAYSRAGLDTLSNCSYQNIILKSKTKDIATKYKTSNAKEPR